MDSGGAKRFLGITVLGDFILSEGVEPVLDNICRAGASAVACNPTVTVASPQEGVGSFQPPADAGTSPRLFDRPLFGKHALWVQTAASYHPHAELYKEVPYGPRRTNELTDQHGAKIAEFIDAAIARGLKVYLQLGAVQPTGLRDEDRPRLPTGALPENRMADTGSLASRTIRAYNRAYVADLLAAYPGISGFRPDWPEYPCYTAGEVFQDFSAHAESWAGEHGFDFDLMRRHVGALYRYLYGSVTDDDLVELAGPDRGKFRLASLLGRWPGVAEWLRFKSALSADILQSWREANYDAGGKDLELGGHAFMPPYSLFTGFDFTAASEICNSVSPKLYTMHWALMVTFWGTAMLQANPGLSEPLVVAALLNLMDLVDEPQTEKTLADYHYPAPDEPHPVDSHVQQRKLLQVVRAAGGRAPVHPVAHGYGPLDDFRRRIELVAASPVDGMWINRYGYLSDAKLDAIAEVWR